MTGHDPDSRWPTDGPDRPAQPRPNADRPVDGLQLVPPSLMTDPAVTGPRPGGGISLIVALLGLLGAAVGIGWVWLDNRIHLAPDGLWGGILLLIASALTVLGLLLLVGGLGYYVLGPAFAGPQAAWRGVGSHRLVIATTILVVVLANVGPVAYVAVVGAGGLCTIPGFVTAAASVDVVLLAITYLRFIRPGVLTVSDLGLNQGRLPYLVGVGLLLGIGVLIFSAAIQTALQSLGVKQTQMESLQCVRDFPLSGFFAVLAIGGLLAPIAEELYFRGYVFRSYLRTQSPPMAYGATSVLFAVLHLNWQALLPILVLSLLLCLAYRRTGSIIPSIVGHALNNTAAFCILYFTNGPL
jgi:membrane protease YdiL (CAAX protease family)